MVCADFGVMALRSKQTIFDAALLRCGYDKNNGDAGHRDAMEANYDEIVRSAFEDGDGSYTFGREYQKLTSRAEGSYGYDDAFTLPNRAISIVEVYLDERPCADLLEAWEYDATRNAIMINARERDVHVRFISEGQEHTWSGGFAQGIQRRLEAVIKDRQEEPEEASMKEQEADYKFMKAGIKGSKQRNARPFVRHGSGRLMRTRRTPDIRGYDD